MSEPLHTTIKSYEFKSLDLSEEPINDEGIKNFDLKDLDTFDITEPEQKKKVLRVEREFAQQSQFKISPIVKKHRGISDQEREDQANRIKDLVDKKFSLVEEDAYKKGYTQGIEEGKKEIYEQLRAEVDDKLSHLTEMINEALQLKEDLLKEQKLDVYDLLKNLVKWVIHRELKDDGEYVQRLLERLIMEIETQEGLLIQVNKNYFDQMPEVLKRVEEKLGELKNVRVESDYDIADQGIIIESSNGIINGTLEQQFKSLDVLFESVGLTQERKIDGPREEEE